MPRFHIRGIAAPLRPILVYEIDLTDNNFFRSGRRSQVFENAYLALQHGDDPARGRVLCGHTSASSVTVPEWPCTMRRVRSGFSRTWRSLTNAPWLELLMTAPAATLAKTLNQSTRTVRRWRRKARASRDN
jgi:hypothetical protein